MIDQKEYFLENLDFRIKERKNFYERANPTFRSELKNCVERFETIYFRESYKILIKEFESLNKSK